MNRFIAALALLAIIFLPGCRLSDIATTSGEAMFKDDFTSAWSGWGSAPATSGVTSFQDGTLRVVVPGQSASLITVPGLDFGDARIEADALKLGGTDVNRIGLVCRYSDPGNYYFFIVSTDGFYGLGKMTAGTTTLLGMTEMQRSDAVQPQGVVNHLRADCIGQELTVYDNGRQLASAVDGDHASGDAGFLSGTSSEPGLDVAFDNFVVIKP
jgi:hypothetical protein